MNTFKRADTATFKSAHASLDTIRATPIETVPEKSVSLRFSIFVDFLFFVRGQVLVGYAAFKTWVSFSVLDACRKKLIRANLIRVNFFTFKNAKRKVHVFSLLVVFLYFSLLFNPRSAKYNQQIEGTVSCPNNYAYRLADGHYVRCEDFDEYFDSVYAGKARKDLYVR